MKLSEYTFDVTYIDGKADSVRILAFSLDDARSELKKFDPHANTKLAYSIEVQLPKIVSIVGKSGFIQRNAT